MKETMHVLSPLLSSIPGIRHGFGTRAEPVPAVFEPGWENLRPRWKQVHGFACAEVLTTSQECGEVDALLTRAANTPISVRTADCVPILLARWDGKAVAAVHAGWRGTRARILRHLWAQLHSQGEQPGDWVASVGPAIGPCCYEVSEDLARDFETEFGSSTSCRPVPRPRILDLPAINEAELYALGLAKVEIVRACTLCSRLDEPASSGNPSWRFNSYRRDAGLLRQHSVIEIQGKPPHLV